MQMGQGFPVSIQSLSKAVDYYSKVHLKWSGPSTITALKLVGFCQEIIWYRKADLVSHAFRSRGHFFNRNHFVGRHNFEFLQTKQFHPKCCGWWNNGEVLQWRSAVKLAVPLALELVMGENMEQALARLKDRLVGLISSLE